ncbi:hypothetical protein [Streptomyces aureus]|uniref:hypothetical protein n=1 Tax=Streptomyces aureus TaxID=193461 RepID=UPI0036AE0980
MRIKKSAASFLAACGLLAGSLVGLSATDASAAGVCNVSTVAVNNSSGYGRLKGSTPVRTRPYSECSSIGTFASGSKFFFWCYVFNDYGNEWILGRLDGTQTKGWVYVGDVSWDSGSLAPCY